MSKGSKGRLIVIEGLDGSGKETQTNLLKEKLSREGFHVKKIEFPRYDNPSSALIKMYLNGEFGSRAGDVSPYVASTFYAVDRYASFKQDWEQIYLEGGIILADRYTTSNFVHQAGKINDPAERENFFDWLWNFEYRLYGLPVPDEVFFLDVTPQYNERLMAERKNKFTGEGSKDIHERDSEHLRDSYKNAVELVERFGWRRIACIRDDTLRSIDDINGEIFQLTIKTLNND